MIRSPSFVAPMVPARHSIWTDYLSKVSDEWKTKVGSARRLHGRKAWAARATKACRGLCATDQGIDRLRRIRVCEEEQDERTRSVKNKDGQYPKPDNDTFQAAAAYADWTHAPGFYQIMTNRRERTRWPIAASSLHFAAYRPGQAAECRRKCMKFFEWSFKNGDKMAEELDYVPLPDSVTKLIVERLEVRGQGRRRQGSLELIRTRAACCRHRTKSARRRSRNFDPRPAFHWEE